MAKRLQYDGIKPEAFDQMKIKLKSFGLDLKGNEGNFNEKGVSGQYTYSPESESLILDELSVGFPASMMLNLDTLQKRMTDVVAQHGGRPQQ
ncbi:hypothetical protein [Pontibacter rugosus]|uniref:Polyhydroxyalkanoic acid system protein n=1 Tax=Pontibacter rugosus TaxID=1745966 RepID=A0ABW3STT0_9BACT